MIGVKIINSSSTTLTGEKKLEGEFDILYSNNRNFIANSCTINLSKSTIIKIVLNLPRSNKVKVIMISIGLFGFYISMLII